MKSRLEIPGSAAFGSSGWYVLVTKTTRITHNDYWRHGDPSVLFGFEGEVDRNLTLSMIAFLDRFDAKQVLGGAGAVPVDLKPFDSCGFVVGKDRKLLRGITEDDSLVHAFPMYSCELTEDGSLPPLENFRQWTNIFDPRREPQPWFHFRMSGGRSRLSAQKWSTEKFSTVEGFMAILSQEANSWIEVRNRAGAVLRLPEDTGWSEAKEKLNWHVKHAQQSAAGDAPRAARP